jgi:hypothetical protein
MLRCATDEGDDERRRLSKHAPGSACQVIGDGARGVERNQRIRRQRWKVAKGDAAERAGGTEPPRGVSLHDLGERGVVDCHGDKVIADGDEGAR